MRYDINSVKARAALANGEGDTELTMNLRFLYAGFLFAIAAGINPVFAAPVISDFSPSAGAPGDQVLLSGSGFSSGGLTVRFWNGGNGAVANNIFINSDTLITVSVPSGIITGPISIQQGGGSQSFTANDFLAIGSGPYLTGFSPAYGAVNDAVIITGVHLANPTSVLFHGTNATTFMANAAGTQITTRVPAGATNGVITVSTPNGTSNTLGSFTVVGPGPFITDFSPVSGDAGTKVLIDGLHFTGVTNVTFNGKPGVNIMANSDTLIQVQAPAGLTTGPIRVQTVRGSFVTSSNFFGKPLITGFTPKSGRFNTNVVVTGTNFLGATNVSFNGVSAAFQVLNNTNLNASVPAGAASGLIRIVIPGASAFSPSNFVIKPTISGFSPAFGPSGTSVVITGANFNVGTPVIKFNGVQAAPPTGVSFNQLTVRVPAGAPTGPISLSTADGSDTTTNLFYLPAFITRFSPSNSPAGSRIIISGTNFIGASAVSFNGTPATSFSVSNNTTIGATVPATIVTGPILVTTPAGTIQSSGLFYGAPVITSFSPMFGLPGTNVTIQGLNFLGARAQFNGFNAQTVSINNTQIVATVPVGAVTGPITVSAPGGTNTTSVKFTVAYTSDLQVTQTNSPNPVTVGQELTYTIIIFNHGPFTAPNAVFTNLLPATVKLRSVTASPPWTLSTNSTTVIGSTANLTSGSSTSVTITVVPQSAGTITDVLTASSDLPDPKPGDNTVSIVNTVNPAALLSIGLATDHVRIFWPSAFTNYHLQFQDGFTGTSIWAPVLTAPVTSDGFEFVTETNLVPQRFYRLKTP